MYDADFTIVRPRSVTAVQLTRPVALEKVQVAVLAERLGALHRRRAQQAWPHIKITDVDSYGLPDTPLLGSELPLTATQATMFRDYVSAGGHLIAMRPDASGLTSASGVRSPIANAAVAYAERLRWFRELGGF